MVNRSSGHRNASADQSEASRTRCGGSDVGNRRATQLRNSLLRQHYGRQYTSGECAGKSRFERSPASGQDSSGVKTRGNAASAYGGEQSCRHHCESPQKLHPLSLKVVNHRPVKSYNSRDTQDQVAWWKSKGPVAQHERILAGEPGFPQSASPPCKIASSTDRRQFV